MCAHYKKKRFGVDAFGAAQGDGPAAICAQLRQPELKNYQRSAVASCYTPMSEAKHMKRGIQTKRPTVPNCHACRMTDVVAPPKALHGSLPTFSCQKQLHKLLSAEQKKITTTKKKPKQALHRSLPTFFLSEAAS